jgi:hypothetical protein
MTALPIQRCEMEAPGGFEPPDTGFAGAQRTRPSAGISAFPVVFWPPLAANGHREWGTGGVRSSLPYSLRGSGKPPYQLPNLRRAGAQRFPCASVPLGSRLLDPVVVVSPARVCTAAASGAFRWLRLGLRRAGRDPRRRVLERGWLRDLWPRRRGRRRAVRWLRPGRRVLRNGRRRTGERRGDVPNRSVVQRRGRGLRPRGHAACGCAATPIARGGE